MTDTQIGPPGASQIMYQGVQTLTVLNCTADYTGSFSGFQTLDIGPTASFLTGCKHEERASIRGTYPVYVQALRRIP